MFGINTNCGLLQPLIFNPIEFAGAPDLTQSHIPYFHSMVCKLAYNISQQHSWVLVITPESDNLMTRIAQLVPEYEPQEISKWNTSSIINDTWTNEAQGIVGCIFAQGVGLPGETIAIEHAGITEGSRRGFINAPIVNGRADFEPLQISFLETTQSLVDGVLRPWSILVGHEGLIARGKDKSIKATINVYQLARAGELGGAHTPNIIRKMWTFTGCVPVTVSSEELSYTGGDYGKRQVFFVYNNYTVEGSRNSLLSNNSRY